MRGDTFEKWGQRVALAEVGLSEKAAKELRDMQIQIGHLIGTGAQFDPSRVVADPGRLLASVVRLKSVIETRDRLQHRFRLLLRLGPVFFWTLLALAAGLTLTFTYYGGITSNSFLGNVGIAISAVSGIIFVLCFGVYVYLQQYLSGAEILAASERSNA